MTADFNIGPFAFEATGPAQTIDGESVRRWEMRYGPKSLGWHRVGAAAPQSVVAEAFEDERAAFVASAKREHLPPLVRLYDLSRDEMLAAVRVVGGVLPGMEGVIPNDSSVLWLLSEHRPPRAMAVTLPEFVEICARHAAPARAWIAGLLPDDVLTADPGQWRAPSSWELRHVVGQGSLTGVTGAGAADLVGVTPQNFRKYTAADGAASRQAISYSMWHLLLHKLGVQAISAGV